MQDELEKEGEVEAMCWREERFPPFGDAKKFVITRRENCGARVKSFRIKIINYVRLLLMV